MAKICFVSFEIHPTVQGGCGVLIHNAARLLLSQGHKIIFLLDLPEEYFRQYNSIDIHNLPNYNNCRAYHVQTITSGMRYSPCDFKSVFEYKAYRFHNAAKHIYDLEHPDVIEFFEYCGSAYYALSSKVTGACYQNTHLAVRLHNSIELIDRQQPGCLHGIDRYMMFGLEHQALRLAETILYPSHAYLEQEYLPYYENWFGNLIFSKPPLVDKPKIIGNHNHPDSVLFYGRLFGFKGVDRFVDAAVMYLSNSENPRRKFYLVGYDSYLPPDSKGSYQDFLLYKIPNQFRDFFHFTGHLNWQDLEKLLPQMLFAVIPSYFESFSYAAHELYAVGIPLIVSNIPAFTDYFHHEENALVFDGTISDLTRQIQRLSTDEALRQKITHPYSLSQDSLGDFYMSSDHPSWISQAEIIEKPSLLICILCDQKEELDQTINSLSPVLTDQIKIVLLTPYNRSNREAVATWFLGKILTFETETGRQLLPTEVQTSQALLIIRAGDVLDPRYITNCLSTLQHQPQISFVGSWKEIIHDGNHYIETLPLDATLELLPLLSKSKLSRFIMRTNPGTLLIDLFDSRAGTLGELEYLWKLDSEQSCGIIIPEPFIIQSDEGQYSLDANALDYLVIRDDNTWRKKRLSRYFLSLANRKVTLRNHFQTEWLDSGWSSDDKNLNIEKWISRLKNIWLYEWISKFPWLKKIARKIVITLLNLSDVTNRMLS